jgi:amidophosphoribosyltransferase
MAKLEEFIAFRAALALHEEGGSHKEIIDSIYTKCKESSINQEHTPPNHVKALYAPFTAEQISKKMAQMLKNDSIKAEVEIIFQTVEGLHTACPKKFGRLVFHRKLSNPWGMSSSKSGLYQLCREK